MADLPTVKLSLGLITSSKATIEIDGVAIPYQGLVIEAERGETTKISLVIIPGELSIEGQAKLEPFLRETAVQGVRTHGAAVPR